MGPASAEITRGRHAYRIGDLALRARLLAQADDRRRNRSLHLPPRTAPLADVDPEIATAINDEAARLNGNIELIASENVVSRAVLEAMGSVMTNKYAEGYPGKRYYGGCENMDTVEDIARDR